MKYLRCCICGTLIRDGFGNNPSGSEEMVGVTTWKSNDRCCDDCNSTYVIRGRLMEMFKKK